MPDTFESLLVKLRRANVDFLVAGGVAVCLNGFVRTTQDLDLLVEASPANLERLLSCLAGFGEGFARELTAADFRLEEGAIRVIEEFTLDLFTLMRRHNYADFASSARSLEIEGVSIAYLSPEALIELKGPSSRHKDQLDVSALRAIITGATPRGSVDLAGLTPPPNAEPNSDE
jgi:hypothetical protein